MEIIRFVVGVLALAAAAFFAWQFWKGNLLSLIATPRTETKTAVHYPAGTVKAAQRCSWVMVAVAAVVAMQLAGIMGHITNSPLFIIAAGLLTDVALIAFYVSIISALLMQHKAHRNLVVNGKVSRMVIFLVAVCIALGLVSFFLG